MSDLREWIDEVVLALHAAVVIGEREGTRLNYVNHGRLIASKPSDADILAAVRTLPGVTTAETVMDHKQFRSWYIPMDEPGTYLLVPLSEEE